VCYEGKGVLVDIKLLNKKTDIENGIDPLITRALKVLKSKNAGPANKRRLIARASCFPLDQRARIALSRRKRRRTSA